MSNMILNILKIIKINLWTLTLVLVLIFKISELAFTCVIIYIHESILTIIAKWTVLKISFTFLTCWRALLIKYMKKLIHLNKHLDFEIHSILINMNKLNLLTIYFESHDSSSNMKHLIRISNIMGNTL